MEAARQRQWERFAVFNDPADENSPPLTQNVIACNADMRPAEVRQFCELDETSRTLMRLAMNQLKLSACAYHCILKLACMITYLATSEQIQPTHLVGVLPYTPLLLLR